MTPQNPLETLAGAASRRILGVDFSGAVDAGQKIWIASAVSRDGTLRIEDCFRAEDLPGSGRERDGCLHALQKFIGRDPGRVFGIDLPFGLPRCLVPEKTWEEFVLSFPKRYRRPEEFREKCLRAARGKMIKRLTDITERTPWAPYHMRQFRQAFFGIGSVLHPLVRDGRVCVLPLQDARRDKPWLIEICPASTLKREKLYAPYKGKTPRHLEERKKILKGLERTGRLEISSRSVRKTVYSDPGGDALDGVVAALAVFRALQNPGSLLRTDHECYAMEGCVQV